MRKFLALVAVLTGTTSFLAVAQNPQHAQDMINKFMPRPVPQSPNVAALGKYGDYQVSHFTGLPEISIPIFEARSGSLSVPITLSYHASGIKPTDVAGWVGMGWSLSGWQISRNIRGKPDEQDYANTPLNANASVCGTYYYLQYSALGVLDTEPDVFSYSFPGKSGKFIWTYDQAPYLFPYEPIIINNTNFDKFQITDENGVTYTFGKNSQGVASQESTTATNGGNPSFTGTTAWHMMDMVAPNSDDRISISYQTVGSSSTHDIAYSYLVMDQCSASNGANCPTDPHPPQPVMNIDSYMNQRGFQSIIFENGKIDFALRSYARNDVSTTLYPLDSITLYSLKDGSYVSLKTAKFHYSYFTNANGGNQALKLDSLEIKDQDSKVVQVYRFTYFTNSFSWNVNSSSFLNARDLWGYYNGAIQNTDLLLPTTIPFQQLNTSSPVDLTFGGAVDRNVNTQYIKEGVLQRIDFPTGGYTEFDFESNRYDNSGTTTLAGGLRVTRITSSDGGTAPPIVKAYKYGAGESGLGVPMFTPYQFNYSSSQLYFGDCQGVNPYVNYRSRTYFSNSAFNFESASPVVYPYVTEYIGDPEGTTNGKTIYEFDSGMPSGDVDHVIPGSSKYWRNSFSWKRGKLTRKTVYDNASNKLLETQIQYSNYQDASNLVGIGAYPFIVGNNGLCSEAGQLCTNEAGESVHMLTYFFTTFYQTRGAILQSNVTETTYQNGDLSKFVTTQTYNSYDGLKMQLTTSTKTYSTDLEESVTINWYPFQLAASVNSFSTGAAQGIYMLNSKNVLSTPIETYTYLQNTDGSNKRLISGQVTTFRQNESNINFVVPDKVYLWESATPLDQSLYSPVTINATNSGIDMHSNYKERVAMISYDNSGNIQTVSKSSDAPIAYQYGFNKTLPVAEVINAQNTFNSISQVTPSTGSVAITMGGSGTTVTQAYPFTVDYTGTVYLKLGVSGTPSYSTTADYSGISGGSTTLATGGCGLTIIPFNNVTPGNYTITITLTTPNPGVGGCGEIVYPKNVTTVTSTGFSEFLFEGFEESLVAGVVTNASLSHTGNKYFQGDYAVNFIMPNARSYKIEYWYLDATNKWQHIVKPYSGTSMALSEGSAIDDIRIYPLDAQMKSYTYDPLVGMTSSINESGQTYRYQYDNFNRLWRIFNEKGTIEKQYTYHYKGNVGN